MAGESGSTTTPIPNAPSSINTPRLPPNGSGSAFFLLGSAMVNVTISFMSLPSVTLALLSSLLIVGCATNEPQPSAATQTQLEKRDVREYNKEVEGRVP